MNEEFNLKEFRDFVKSKIVWIGPQYNSLKEPEIINAICQFKEPSYQILNIDRTQCSAKLRKVFNYTLLGKPNNVSVNKWFLYQFGFKYCPHCKENLLFKEFNIGNRQWDKLHTECRNCSNNITKKHYYNNTEKYKASGAKRRAAKLNATPKWLTKQDYVEIEDIYWQSKEYNRLLYDIFHVDHIIPLQGKNVCGLHVPWNLQILTEKENLSKNNKY